MKSKQMIIWTLLAVLTLMTWGCGSSRDSSGSIAGDDTTLANAKTLGIANCLKCHGVTTGETDRWLNGRHGNPDSSPNTTSSTCTPCHDPLGDGLVLDQADITLTNRSVVGCESCHGGGQYHLGNPAGVPFPKPTEVQCAGCHQDMHGLTVAADYENSAHKTTLNSHIYPDATQTTVRARCSKCHTDEGARQYRLTAGDHDELVTAFGTEPDLIEFSNVTCRTCHTPHQEDIPLLATDEVFTGSGQYNTCTNCHQLTYPAAHATTPDGWMQDVYHAPPVNPFGAYSDIISDTHFDDPVTDTFIEGYVVRSAQPTACADCHNLHAADNTINNQWAISAHGRDIVSAKLAAEIAGNDVFAAGVDKGPWGKTSDSCSRCHTATGAANYLDDPVAYDPTANDFSHLVTGQIEMLYCWGCHDNTGQGTLRNPGGITIDYTNGATYTYADVFGSNVCIGCHSGRTSGDTVKATVSAQNPHYLPAAGIVFAATGYTYGTRDYSIPASDPHNLLGMGTTGEPAIDDNYTEGPCVTCHFDSEDGSHLLSPFTQYSATDLALNPVCVNCHSSRGAGSNAAEDWFGHEFTTADLVAGELAPHKGRYLAALEALNVLLPATPVTVDDFGAVFNYDLMIGDPGGVAHNRRYTRRLIYDSIDYLDDGTLDYSVAATLNALPDTTPYKVSAKSYLLNAENGDSGDRH